MSGTGFDVARRPSSLTDRPVPDEVISYFGRPSVTVVRTWRRDQSCNLMPLDEAAWNLLTNWRSLDETNPARLEEISSRLLNGEVLETPHATFALLSTMNGR
jgi:hypothetical protein